MSVKKLSDQSKSRAPNIPYTQICNNVINNIKNGDAFLVWCYLASKTEKWIVIKGHIKNRFGFGNSKLKKIFSYLHRSGLLKYCAITCAKGKFAHWDIAIQDGAHFDAQVGYIFDNKEEKQCAPVGQKSTRWINHPVDNGPLLNKDKNNKQREEHIIKSYCASDDARPIPATPSHFDSFWEAYPRKKDKARARHIWDRKKLDSISDKIIDKVSQQMRLDNQWQTAQFIPHPATYLRNERWEDEIEQINTTSPKKMSVGQQALADAFKEVGNLRNRRSIQ